MLALATIFFLQAENCQNEIKIFWCNLFNPKEKKKKKAVQCTKLPPMRDSRERFIVQSLTLSCKRLFPWLEFVTSKSYSNNFTFAPRLPFFLIQKRKRKKSFFFLFSKFISKIYYQRSYWTMLHTQLLIVTIDKIQKLIS